MRKRADWWVLVDDMVLEFLRDERSGTPKTISEEIGKSQGYVNQRCSKLASYGLVRKVARGVYVLTDEGEQYLDEELDVRDLELEQKN